MNNFLKNDEDQTYNSSKTYMIRSREDSEEDKVVIVKRIDMVYNNHDCHVLNFSDLTSYLKL